MRQQVQVSFSHALAQSHSHIAEITQKPVARPADVRVQQRAEQYWPWSVSASSHEGVSAARWPVNVEHGMIWASCGTPLRPRSSDHAACRARHDLGVIYWCPFG